MIILPSFIGIISWNQNKDPYKPARIQWKVGGFFRCSIKSSTSQVFFQRIAWIHRNNCMFQLVIISWWYVKFHFLKEPFETPRWCDVSSCSRSQSDRFKGAKRGYVRNPGTVPHETNGVYLAYKWHILPIGCLKKSPLPPGPIFKGTRNSYGWKKRHLSVFITMWNFIYTSVVLFTNQYYSACEPSKLLKFTRDKIRLGAK